MEAILLQVLAGLATGSIYASLALALVMIYQATHLVNFAQGEMAMFATYIAWSLINAGMGYWAAFLLTVLIAFVLGVLIERVVIRPVENAPVLAVVVVFIGLLVILNSIAGWIFTYTIKSFPSPFPAALGIRYMSPHQVGALLVTLAVRQCVVESEFGIGESRHEYGNVLFIRGLKDSALTLSGFREMRSDGAVQFVGAHHFFAVPPTEHGVHHAFDVVEVLLGLKRVVDAVVAGFVKFFVAEFRVVAEVGAAGGFD